ncbi:hypothetical protein [Acinetobacter larvae]|uniref:hypothetical protein n=1 Tax=Acinetobacter larvae TaxID=1789224 RepID=UPI000901E1F3|nr:hypothetical protein [Acinetobacter larvae]
MDVLQKICNQIILLNTGEHWTLSAQELFISRSDFHSISVFLSRESEKGAFSLTALPSCNPLDLSTSLTIIKN